MADTEKFMQGTCEYCEQAQAVEPCATQEEADELATKSCKCEDGKTLSKKDEALGDAQGTIDEYFTEGEINEDVRELMHQAARLVCEGLLPQVVFTLRRGANGTSAVFGRTDKGKFTVKRKDNASKEKVIGE